MDPDPEPTGTGSATLVTKYAFHQGGHYTLIVFLIKQDRYRFLSHPAIIFRLGSKRDFFYISEYLCNRQKIAQKCQMQPIDCYFLKLFLIVPQKLVIQAGIWKKKVKERERKS